MTPTPTGGPSAESNSPADHDVLVVGSGTAGLSAATSLARYGFDTLVLGRGASAIRQCACLENYLGFPAGITPDRFLALGRTQVEHEGGTVREESVECVERIGPDRQPSDPDGTDPAHRFRVESNEGTYRVRYVLAATAYDGEMFGDLADEVDTDTEYGRVDSEAGRTAVDGLYAAGWMTTETVHQAIVNAGHGARVAVALIRDDLAARYWPAVAEEYVDWVVPDGRYGGEDWEEHTREWFEETVLVDEVDDELADAALDHLRSAFRAREIDLAERERRDREGQRRLLEQFDDDVIREYARSLPPGDQE
jgi:NADPH-dependent 2,4-dienoyl-CoA reductase/sulfur reductase-like enzyme